MTRPAVHLQAPGEYLLITVSYIWSRDSKLTLPITAAEAQTGQRILTR